MDEQKGTAMPKFLIERKLPGVGSLGSEEMKGIAQKSNSVLADMQRNGKNVQWVESYVTDDAIHCVYVAPDAEAVREHARGGGFPADNVMEVKRIISPTTAESG